MERRNLRFEHPGHNRTSLNGRLEAFEWLKSVCLDGSSSEELRLYLETDFERFIYTLGLVPDDFVGRGLEIGANPYFMSLLLKEFRPSIDFDFTNYFAGAGDQIEQTVSWISPDGQEKTVQLKSRNVNVELDRVPVDDGQYDIVLFCEVLEHFTSSPLAALNEINRILKPGGLLVLTTPNVARFENVIALLEGRNIYDPYSGYGPHGRHNREYSRHELHQLLAHAGFTADLDFTSDVHPGVDATVSEAATLSLLSQIPSRHHDLGQYLFSRWIKAGEGTKKLPRWLFRSYPDSYFE